MKKIILIGRVAAGKTTLTQALRGEEIKYFNTQYVNYMDTIIDTPGEYTELRQTSGALALYSYEADVVGLVLSANEPYSIFSPCITSLVNREVVGIISGIDKPDANVERVERWLRLAGCKKIFPLSAVTGEGIDKLLDFLSEDDKKEKEAERPLLRSPTTRAEAERLRPAPTWVLLWRRRVSVYCLSMEICSLILLCHFLMRRLRLALLPMKKTYIRL